MRKRSPSGGRTRAGGRGRRTHESRRCVARCLSCSITSRRAAKNGRADSLAHTRPPRGRRERHHLWEGGGGTATYQTPGGAPPGPPPCARVGPAPLAAGASAAVGDLGRPGAPAVQRHRNPGPTQPWHPGQCPSARDQVIEKMFRQPPTRPGPRPEMRPVADCVPRGGGGARKSSPGNGLRASVAVGPGIGSHRVPPRPRRSERCGLRGMPSTSRRGGRPTRPTARNPTPPSVARRIRPPSAHRPVRGPAARGGGWPLPHHWARDATSPWPAPTPGHPAGFGLRAQAPSRSGGTRSWYACHGPAPLPLSTGPGR